jgi:hypothetical protein
VIMPTNSSPSTTASSRTACARNNLKAECKSASASMVTTGLVITFSTAVVAARSWANPRRTRSRSVTIPTSRSSSITASEPTPA